MLFPLAEAIAGPCEDVWNLAFLRGEHFAASMEGEGRCFFPLHRRLTTMGPPLTWIVSNAGPGLPALTPITYTSATIRAAAESSGSCDAKIWRRGIAEPVLKSARRC